MKNIKSLNCLIDDPELHKTFVHSVVESIETHIQSMGMVKGLVIRKAYAAIKAVKPGYVEHIIDVISKDYVREFLPLHDQYRESQHLPAQDVVALPVYMKDHYHESEQIFWRVADNYAQKRANSLLGKTYNTFRSTIAGHLPTALDMIFKIIESCTLYNTEE